MNINTIKTSHNIRLKATDYRKMSYRRGDIITIRVLVEEEPETDMLCRTPSRYGYGFDLELRPNEDKQYVVCNGDYTNGFTLMKLDNPDTPIGFIILTQNVQDYYRISQVGFEPVPIQIIVQGKYKDEIPTKTPIGSQVFLLNTIKESIIY